MRGILSENKTVKDLIQELKDVTSKLEQSYVDTEVEIERNEYWQMIEDIINELEDNIDGDLPCSYLVLYEEYKRTNPDELWSESHEIFTLKEKAREYAEDYATKDKYEAKVCKILEEFKGKDLKECELCGWKGRNMKELSGKTVCGQCYMGEVENPEHRVI